MKNIQLRKRNTINQKRANKSRKRAIHMPTVFKGVKIIKTNFSYVGEKHFKTKEGFFSNVMNYLKEKKIKSVCYFTFKSTEENEICRFISTLALRVDTIKKQISYEEISVDKVALQENVGFNDRGAYLEKIEISDKVKINVLNEILERDSFIETPNGDISIEEYKKLLKPFKDLKKELLTLNVMVTPEYMFEIIQKKGSGAVCLIDNVSQKLQEYIIENNYEDYMLINNISDETKLLVFEKSSKKEQRESKKMRILI